MKRNYTLADSPVETRRKQLPRGDGSWAGYGAVCNRLSAAADRMANSGADLSDAHVETMAVLGSGHEETMKGHLHWLMVYGYIQ